MVSRGARRRETSESDGKQICLFGGGDLFRDLVERGEVDRIEVGLVPVLLGGGIPFLPPGLEKHTCLRLLESRQYQKLGVMILTYQVLKNAA